MGWNEVLSSFVGTVVVRFCFSPFQPKYLCAGDASSVVAVTGIPLYLAVLRLVLTFFGIPEFLYSIALNVLLQCSKNAF